MAKVSCYDPKYLKANKKRPGHNCQNFDQDTKKCKAKQMGGGKHPTMFPAKNRKCELYKEHK